MPFIRLRSQGLLFLCCVLMLGPLWAAVPNPANAPVTDLRILIDISGSMKHNDPHNLRAPALRLLVGLMPDGMRAGVWTFGQYVNMLVPLGTVTPAWKRRALAAAARINSRGLFTNIGGALDRATVGWSRADPRYRRQVLLLTDGMVDIAKSAQKNREEQARILHQIVPRLKRAGARVHTIALSSNADRAFLRTLALQTGGGFVQVDNARDLERVFLHLFEQVVPAETLPLHNNRFKVDAQVKDMTVLVFRKSVDRQVRLDGPDGSTYGYGHTVAGMTWRHEADYDMVTVNHPAPGEWNLEAAIDPDNRVLVATNLKLVATPLPNHLLVSHKLLLRCRLLEAGKPVVDTRLLNLTRFVAKIGVGDAQVRTLVLHDNGQAGDAQAGDGIYSAELAMLVAGDKSITLEALAPSFERAYHQTVKVYSAPFKLDIDAPTPVHPMSYRIKIIPEPTLVALDGLQLKVEVEGKTYRPGRMISIDTPTWGMELPADLAGQTMSLRLQGMQTNGTPVDIVIKRVLPAVVKVPGPPRVPKATAPATPPATQRGDRAHWLGPTLWVLGANLSVLAVIFAWIWWRRRQMARRVGVSELEAKTDAG